MCGNRDATAQGSALNTQEMAKQSIALFVSQLQAAQGPLKVKVAQIVFDLMMVHDTAELFDKALKVS
jgi:condensin complex subunit 3